MRAPVPAQGLSLAVLPFASLSADATDEYFASGMTEEVISKVARIDGLTVIARASVMRYKKTALDTSAIAAELGVTHLLESTVRRDESRVHVAVQLVDTVTNAYIWTRTFDRGLLEVFDIHAEIAREVASVLQRRLSPDGLPADVPPTRDLAAYDSYLRARELNEAVREHSDAVIALLEEAMRLDPDFAAACAMLAHVLVDRAGGAADLDRARGLAERAAALNPRLALAHEAVATVLWTTGHIRQARRKAARAAALDPSSTDAIALVSAADSSLGQYADAIVGFEQAARADPRNPHMAAALSLVHVFVGDDERAEAYARAALSIGPDLVDGHVRLVQSALRAGRPDDALRHAMSARERHPDSATVVAAAGDAAAFAGDAAGALRHYLRARDRRPDFDPTQDIALAVKLADACMRTGNRSGADALLDEALTRSRAAIESGDERPARRLTMAAAQALRGQTDDAVSWLERAYDAGWHSPWLVKSPWFEALEPAVAYQSLVQKMEADVASIRRISP